MCSNTKFACVTMLGIDTNFQLLELWVRHNILSWNSSSPVQEIINNSVPLKNIPHYKLIKHAEHKSYRLTFITYNVIILCQPKKEYFYTLDLKNYSNILLRPSISPLFFMLYFNAEEQCTITRLWNENICWIKREIFKVLYFRASSVHKQMFNGDTSKAHTSYSKLLFDPIFVATA